MSKVKFVPLGDRLIINRVEGVSQIGHIIVPITATEVPQEGIIVAVGDGPKDSNGVCSGSKFKKGDRVLFGKFAGAEVTYRPKEDNMKVVEMQIIREDDVLCLVEGYDDEKRQAK